MSSDSGFILLETLVSLAIFTILVTSSFSLMNTVTGSYQSEYPEKIQQITSKLSSDRFYYQGKPEIDLRNEEIVSDVSEWRVYEYRRTPTSEPILIPVYYDRTELTDENLQ